VDRELANGRLVALLGHEWPSELSYHLVYPPHKAESPVLRALESWLQDQAQAYLASVGTSGRGA
jgi:LysR family glycine cleavage system transcriptional activator